VTFTGRRVRGWLLRAVMNPSLAVTLGLALAVPAAWVGWWAYAWETWYTDGLALVAGATGLALILAGLGGRRPDWIDPDE
jgi:hypothetical protein